MAKALLFLKASTNPKALLDGVLEFAERAYTTIQDCPSTLQVMASLEEDILLNKARPNHVADVTVQIKTQPGQTLQPALDAWAGLQGQLGGELDREGSMALVMREQRWLPLSASSQPVYYHYLMVRKPGFNAADYEDYYLHFHHRFGFKTAAIDGYSQNMIDNQSSRALSETLGLGGHYEVDSISELHLPSVEAFIASPSIPKIGPLAAEDEARFVDREASISYCSDVHLRPGDFSTIYHSAFE